MKVHYRIPTEMYAYVEVEKDYQIDPSPAEVQLHYRELTEAFRAKVGITIKEFNVALDEFLKTGTLVNGTELYQLMSPEQQQVFQEIKKSLKRIKADVKI